MLSSALCVDSIKIQFLLLKFCIVTDLQYIDRRDNNDKCHCIKKKLEIYFLMKFDKKTIILKYQKNWCNGLLENIIRVFWDDDIFESGSERGIFSDFIVLVK